MGSTRKANRQSYAGIEPVSDPFHRSYSFRELGGGHTASAKNKAIKELLLNAGFKKLTQKQMAESENASVPAADHAFRHEDGHEVWTEVSAEREFGAGAALMGHKIPKKGPLSNLAFKIREIVQRKG